MSHYIYCDPMKILMGIFFGNSGFADNFTNFNNMEQKIDKEETTRV